MGNCCAASKTDQVDAETGGPPQETRGDSSPIQEVSPDETTNKDGPTPEAESLSLAELEAKKKAKQDMDAFAQACNMASRCSIMWSAPDDSNDLPSFFVLLQKNNSCLNAELYLSLCTKNNVIWICQ